MVPYQPIPTYLQELVTRVSLATGNVPYNAVLVRLYFDGNDEITWHTDGRTFLGPTPTIASLSLGARCSFQLRKMTDVWPCAGTPDGGVDRRVAPIDVNLRGGDLLVMSGHTQRGWVRCALFVFASVYLCLCACACMYACMYATLCLCLCVCVCVCVCVCLCVCLCVCVCDDSVRWLSIFLRPIWLLLVK